MEPIDVITVGDGQRIDEVEGALKRAGYEPRRWAEGTNKHRGGCNSVLVFAGSPEQIRPCVSFCSEHRIPMIWFSSRKTRRIFPRWHELKFAVVKNPRRMRTWVELMEKIHRLSIWDDNGFQSADRILRRKE